MVCNCHNNYSQNTLHDKSELPSADKCRIAAEAASQPSNQRRRWPDLTAGHCENPLVGVRDRGELGRETVK